MSSNDIYQQKYLYIKQHTITKKLYFGMTTTSDPEKYLGSGSYWKKHIKKHGISHVTTLWFCLFLCDEDITKFAVDFSINNNIVESDDWANLMIENGLPGSTKRFPEILDTCPVCGNEFSYIRYKYTNKIRYCSKQCANTAIAVRTKSIGGHVTQKEAVSQYWKGKKRGPQSDEHKSKIPRPIMIGWKWMKNDETNHKCRVPPEKVDEYLAIGYRFSSARGK